MYLILLYWNKCQHFRASGHCKCMPQRCARRRHRLGFSFFWRHLPPPPPVVLFPSEPKSVPRVFGKGSRQREVTEPSSFYKEYQQKQAEVQSAAIKKRTDELEGLFDSKNPDLLYGGKKRRKTDKRTKKSKKHRRRRGTRKH